MAMSCLQTLTLTLTLILLSIACHEARKLPETQTNTEFIKTSCSLTKYPSLCFSSLSTYASTIQTSPMQLALTGLSVSLNSAKSASASMTQMSTSTNMGPYDKQAMKDCMDTLSDSIDELKQSMQTMSRLKGKQTGFQINSVQTWVSAALTDENTCMEGFRASGRDVQMRVRTRVLNVAQLTSNALGLVNGLSSSIVHSTP